MSYILDALKKSEEERHQGQVPNLGSNSTLIHTHKTKSSLWLWVIAVLLVLNITFVGFWVLNENSAPIAIAEAPISSERGDSIESAEVNSLATEPLPQTTLKSASSVLAQEPQWAIETQQANRVDSPKKVFTAQRSEVQEYIQAEDTKPEYHSSTQPELITSTGSYQTRNESQAQTAEPVQEAPMLITPKGQSRPYAGPAYTAEDENDKYNKVAVNRTNPRQEVSSRIDAAPVTDQSSIPRVSEKPHSFQIKIPDMTFNSHIYTDTPSARRVMINNIYLREGQVFSGMKVEQIIEGGIILSIEGESFKMGVLRDWYSPR